MPLNWSTPCPPSCRRLAPDVFSIPFNLHIASSRPLAYFAGSTFAFASERTAALAANRSVASTTASPATSHRQPSLAPTRAHHGRPPRQRPPEPQLCCHDCLSTHRIGCAAAHTPTAEPLRQPSASDDIVASRPIPPVAFFPDDGLNHGAVHAPPALNTTTSMGPSPVATATCATHTDSEPLCIRTVTVTSPTAKLLVSRRAAVTTGSIPTSCPDADSPANASLVITALQPLSTDARLVIATPVPPRVSIHSSANSAQRSFVTSPSKFLCNAARVMRACALRAAPACGTPGEQRSFSLASKLRTTILATVSGLSPAVSVRLPNAHTIAPLRRSGIRSSAAIPEADLLRRLIAGTGAEAF
eukprot:6189141-Pleurochrysis_carterae.AAC.2